METSHSPFVVVGSRPSTYAQQSTDRRQLFAMFAFRSQFLPGTMHLRQIYCKSVEMPVLLGNERSKSNALLYLNKSITIAGRPKKCVQCAHSASRRFLARPDVLSDHSLVVPYVDYLDYCNSLISDGLMQRLEAVQNAAARLITGARRRDHISPVLRQLHWLPGPPTSSVQTGRASVQSTAWASPTVLDGRLSTRCRCRSPSTTVI